MQAHKIMHIVGGLLLFHLLYLWTANPDYIRVSQLLGVYNMTRKEYLTGLAEDYGIARSDVFMIADLLGESEDYDGLVSMLEDLADSLERGE